MKFSIPLSGARLLKLGLVAAVATGVLSTVAGHGTLAYFTTQVTSTPNTFSAGNLHFNVTDNNETAAGLTTVTSSITLSNMKPGDSVFAPITVTNVGSLDAQYGMKYSATGGASDLTTHLQIAVVGMGSGTGASCDASHFTTTSVWKEQIVPVAEAMTDAGRTFVNSTSTQAPATDGTYTSSDVSANAYLPLNHAGAANFSSDTLCVEVAWPDAGAPGSLTTGDNAQNAASSGTWTSTVTFTFDGQQRHHPVEFDETSGPASGNY